MSNAVKIPTKRRACQNQAGYAQDSESILRPPFKHEVHPALKAPLLFSWCKPVARSMIEGTFIGRPYP